MSLSLKSYRKALIGLISAFLMLSLMGCTRTKLVFAAPPAQYLLDCPKPNPVLTDNASLAQAYIERGSAIERCNADKQALRVWAKELQANPATAKN